MEDVFRSEEAIEFMAATCEVRRHLKISSLEPPMVARRYKIAVDAYRKYLDDLYIIMPAALYPYDKNDLSTHKYLDVKVNNKKFLCDVINTNWKYR